MARTVRAALAGGLALVTVACGADERTANRVAAPEMSSAGGGLQQFYGQQPAWKPCAAEDDQTPAPSPADERAGFECAKLKVPLDYSDPDGETIEVALNRLPATGPAKRLGSLLTNPGGPGGSGLDFAYGAKSFFTPQMRAGYDIVGMDPRGVGESAPVLCEVTEPKAELTDAAAEAKYFVDGCENKSRKLLPHVGTDDTARDLDVARAALGDPKLNYLGISYGTVLGQFYAQMFPKHVGRIVLDSVANPNGWPGDPTAQAIGFENGFAVMVQDCVERPGCPLGSSRTAAMAKFGELVDRMKKQPLAAEKDDPPVTADEMLGVLSQASYTEAAWPYTLQALAMALKGNGNGIRGLSGANSESGEDSGDGEASGEIVTEGSFQAIMCRHIPPEERTVAAAKEAAKEAIRVAPNFGDYVESTFMNCAQWPAPSLPQAGKAIRAEGAPTILLVANTNDAATPIAWARGVNGQLDDSVLVTNTSGGHGFYPMGNCTHKVVDDFLVSGDLPAVRTCHDRNPDLLPKP